MVSKFFFLNSYCWRGKNLAFGGNYKALLYTQRKCANLIFFGLEWETVQWPQPQQVICWCFQYDALIQNQQDTVLEPKTTPTRYPRMYYIYTYLCVFSYLYVYTCLSYNFLWFSVWLLIKCWKSKEKIDTFFLRLFL